MSNFLKHERLGLIKTNNQNYKMKIIDYKNNNNIIVEFQDDYKGCVHTSYMAFKNGNVKNPYAKNSFGGIVGNKRPASINGKNTKEYNAWKNMFYRCYNEEFHEKQHTYKNAIVCDEWLLYENFYDWVHSQENFEQWLLESNWELDKDILVKGNKIYSPETCCLVPKNINTLFAKANKTRGELPIGVYKMECGKYTATCGRKSHYVGICDTAEEAFILYKEYKENIIKQAAEEEYDKGNIIKSCYEAMINYKVEITD